MNASVSKNPHSSPDLVVDSIRRGILMGRFVPGQRLIEADLTRELGVSRGPIREALKRLAAEGVVGLSMHRGAHIRMLTRKEIGDLLEVLEATMGLAVELAAQRIGLNDNRKKLTDAFKQLQRHGPNGDRIMLAIDRTAFYDTLLEITGNRELARVHPAIPTQILRMQIHPFLPPEDRTRQFADYADLCQAVLAGDGRRARRIFVQHVRRSRAQAERLLPLEPLRVENGTNEAPKKRAAPKRRTRATVA